MPLGLDPTVYFRRDDVQSIRAEFGVREDEVLLGYLGRIVREKGLETLLRGLTKIRDLKWRLAVIGSGAFEPDFLRLVAESNLSDRVICKGYIPHPVAPKYFSAFDVTLLPSETQTNWKEQFGRVILESLACGTAVIGSSSGEIGTLINELGGGLVFAERDADALAAAIATLIAYPATRKEMAERGRERILGSYTTKILAARFAETIRQVCHPSISEVTV
jgi:glycosyltransferase involved in cell wall biosynthesis